jgi:hypothetical protein
MKRLPVRPRPPRIHALILAVHLGLALSYVGLVGMAFARGETWRADFTAHYTGALLIREGHGAALYDLDLQGRRQRALLSGRHLYDGLLPYHHPPYGALLLSPLAALPLPVAFGVWTALNALIWAGFLWDLGRWARPWGGTARALTVSAVAALPGVLFSFLLGAFTVWTMAALWGFYRALRAGREGTASLWLALASIHPQAVLFPALLLFTIRGWRALSVFLGAMALLVGISAWALGPAIWADYLIVLGKAATAFGRQGIDPEAMVNLKGTLTRLLGPGHGVWINALSALGLALGMVAIVALGRGSRPAGEADFDRRFSGAMAMGLFLSPHVNPQDGLLLALPGIAGYAYLRRACPASGLLRAFEGIALGFPLLWLIERFALGTNWSVILGSLALIGGCFVLRGSPCRQTGGLR